MAQLNPNLRQVENSAGLVNSSRGATARRAERAVADTSQASNLESVANIGLTAVNAADSLIKLDIDRRATEATDQVFDEFGVNDAALEGRDISNEPLPREIADAERNIGRLTRAMQSGVVSPRSYWTRMHSITRQIRSRYPGHREYIDQRVSALAGGKPQNEILKDLQRQAASSSSAQAKENQDYMRLVLELRREGTLPVNWEQYGNRTELINATADDRRRKFKLDQMQSEIAFRKANLENTEELTERAAQTAVENNVVFMLRQGLGTLGKDRVAITAALQEAQRAGASASPEQIEALKTQMAAFRTSVMDTVQETLDPEQFPGLSTAARNEAMNVALAEINTLEAAINSKDYGLLQMKADKLEAMKQSDDINFLNNAPQVRKDAAAARVLGRLGDLYTQSTADLADVRVKEYTGATISEVYGTEADEDAPSVKGFIQRGTERGMNPVEVSNGVLNAHLNVLNDTNANPDAKVKAARSLFGPENQGFMDIVSTTSRSGNLPQMGILFNRLVNPEMYRSMRQLREQGETQTWNNFRDWTQTTFASVMRRTANSIIARNEDQSITGTIHNTVNYDRATNTFSLPETASGSIDPLNTELQNFNLAIQAIKPMLQEDGIDVNQFLNAAFNGLVPGGRSPALDSMRSNLGGPGSLVDGGDTRFTEYVRRVVGVPQLDAVEGTAAELRELINLLNTTTNPRVREAIEEQINILRNPGNLSGTGVQE